MKVYSVSELAVNEQNPLAKGFYEHMGFHVYKRTDIDEQGNPVRLPVRTEKNKQKSSEKSEKSDESASDDTGDETQDK